MKRILLVEADATTRSLVQRVLAAMGAVVTAPASAEAVAADAAFDAAVVDAVGPRGGLEALRAIRARFPTLPIVLTSALLTPKILLEAIRIGVTDALAKPFSPAELREAVGRALAASSLGHREALEYSAAVARARAALAAGHLADSRAALAEVHARSPLDAEAMALEALVAELDGRDADADRGYRAALALRHDEDTPTPHPLDGIARLAAYGEARPADRLPPAFRGAAAWIVADASELGSPPPDGAGDRTSVTVLSLGLDEPKGALYLRVAPSRAFALVAAPFRPDEVATILDALDLGPIRVSARTREALDVQLVERRRAGRIAGRARPS